MKKILIGTIALTLTASLVGCGANANDTTVTNLCNQLDDTANSVSKIQTVNPSNLDLSKSALAKIASKTTEEEIYHTQNALLSENDYKAQILTKTAQIKKCLNTGCKLTKAEISAIKDLTSSLNKYTNSVSYSKNELDSTIKSITSMKKKEEKNAEKISAKLNRLACNANARSAYYENILNTLEQLGCYFCNDCQQESPALPNDGDSETETIKNIDNYNNNIAESQDNNEEEIDKEFSQPAPTVYNRHHRFALRNIDTYGPYPQNFYNGGYGYGMNGYANGAYGYGNRFGMGYGNSYYGNLNSNNFNRYYAENAQMVNNLPEQRLETEEEYDENNILRNVEDKPATLEIRDVIEEDNKVFKDTKDIKEHPNKNIMTLQEDDQITTDAKVKEVFKMLSQAEEEDLNQKIQAH